MQTYSWKEKLAVFMLPSFQISLQRTKSLILKLGKRVTWIYCRVNFYEGEYGSYFLEYFQYFLNAR